MPTVSTILSDYRADCALRGCRAMASLDSEIRAMSIYFSGLAVAELDLRRLRQYQSDRREQGFAPATVNKHMAILSAALRLAAETEIIDAIPRFPKRLRPAPPRQGFLEHDDYLAIRAELPDWGKLILDFGYYSGWRRQEVLGLTWGEVDLTARRVRLHPSRSKNGLVRIIPLVDFGLTAIQGAFAQSHGDHVFQRDGAPVPPTTWRAHWRKATAAAGRAHFRFHDLRRTVVRRLELAGVPRKTAMAWVGHRTEAIYQRYCITTERDLEPAAHRMLRQITPQPIGGKVVAMFPR